MTSSIEKTFHWFFTVTDLDLITDIDLLPKHPRFSYNIWNGWGMPIEDAYSSGYLVLSHFGTCMCSYVETNLSRTCLVSGLLSFEHPSVLLFCLLHKQQKRNDLIGHSPDETRRHLSQTRVSTLLPLCRNGVLYPGGKTMLQRQPPPENVPIWSWLSYINNGIPWQFLRNILHVKPINSFYFI